MSMVYNKVSGQGNLKRYTAFAFELILQAISDMNSISSVHLIAFLNPFEKSKMPIAQDSNKAITIPRAVRLTPFV